MNLLLQLVCLNCVYMGSTHCICLKQLLSSFKSIDFLFFFPLAVFDWRTQSSVLRSPMFWTVRVVPLWRHLRCPSVPHFPCKPELYIEAIQMLISFFWPRKSSFFTKTLLRASDMKEPEPMEIEPDFGRVWEQKE